MCGGSHAKRDKNGGGVGFRCGGFYGGKGFWHALISTRSKNWLAHELRRLRGFPMQQTLAVTRAAAASRPPHTAKIGSHSSCGRFAASAHNKLLLSHELRPLRGLRAQHTSCSRFAASAQNKLLLSHKLRLLCGHRTQQSSALLHTSSWELLALLALLPSTLEKLLVSVEA